MHAGLWLGVCDRTHSSSYKGMDTAAAVHTASSLGALRFSGVPAELSPWPALMSDPVVQCLPGPCLVWFRVTSFPFRPQPAFLSHPARFLQPRCAALLCPLPPALLRPAWSLCPPPRSMAPTGPELPALPTLETESLCSFRAVGHLPSTLTARGRRVCRLKIRGWPGTTGGCWVDFGFLPGRVDVLARLRGAAVPACESDSGT